MKKIAIFFVLLSFCSCGEPSPQPDEPLYCKIDGKRFRPDNGGDIFLKHYLLKEMKQIDFCILLLTQQKDKQSVLFLN